MHIFPTHLFPNPEVTEAQFNYGIQHSTTIAPHIDQHRVESTKWAEENDADVDMMVHHLQVSFYCSEDIRYNGIQVGPWILTTF